MARRIVPVLISPSSQAQVVQPEFVAAAEQPLNLRINVREQAELAKTLLGPGRKLYIDISIEPKVNWRKVRTQLSSILSANLVEVVMSFVHLLLLYSCRRVPECP